MFTVRQPVAGVAQYTGLAGAGLITFLEANNQVPPDGTSQVPLLLWVSLELAGNPATVDLFLRDPNLATSIIRIGGSTIDSAGAKGVTNSATVGGCQIPIPHSGDGSGGTPWYNLVCITSGKTGDGVLTVAYSYGPEVQ